MSDFNRLIGKLKKQKASFQKLLDVTLPKKSRECGRQPLQEEFP